MQKRTEAEIVKNWPTGSDTPLVTVIAICYCHEKTLRTALDSILAQETRFPFEVLIRDDASPDGSAAIIEEYASAYPRIFRPILEKENQFSTGTQAVLRELKPRIRGRYLAYLECDDFWTDAHKLQQQVEFLEAHPAYLAVAHNCTIVDADGVPTGEQYPECRDEEYTVDHFLRDTLAGQSATLVVRDIFTRSADDHHLIRTAPPGPFDRVLNLTLLLNGRVHCIQKSMSAYRYVTSGGTSYSATYRFDIRRETRFYQSLALYCKRMGRTGAAIGMQRWLIDYLEQHAQREDIREEAAPYLALCRTSITSLTDRLLERRRRCICCGQYVQYEPLPIEQQEAALSMEGFFLPETLNPDAYRCPGCGSTDRERLMLAALERMGLRQKGQDYRILQLAPFPALERYLRALDCELSCQTEQPPVGQYDLILCADVLERVRDDRGALRELKERLKEDGSILLLVPVDLGFSGVDEAWGLSEAENYRRFGQRDRVRRYSREGLLERLAEQFAVQPLGRDDLGEDCCREAGLSDSSTLYVLSKPGHSAAFPAAQPRKITGSTARLVAYIQQPGDACYTEIKKASALLPLQGRYGCTLSLSAFGELARLRIDPMEQPCFLREISVSAVTQDGEALPVPILGTNGVPLADGLLFSTNDPQLELALVPGKYRELSFSCELLSAEAREIETLCGLSDEWNRSAARCGELRDALTQAEAEKAALAAQVAKTDETLAHAEAEKEALTAQLSLAKEEYALIAGSTFWKLTKPLRVLLDSLKKLTKRFKAD